MTVGNYQARYDRGKGNHFIQEMPSNFFFPCDFVYTCEIPNEVENNFIPIFLLLGPQLKRRIRPEIMIHSEKIKHSEKKNERLSYKFSLHNQDL